MAEELSAEQKTQIELAKAQQQQADQPRDLRELIAMEEAKAVAPKEGEKKAKKEPLTQEDMAKVTDLLGQQLSFRKPKEEKKEEKKEEAKKEEEVKAEDKEEKKVEKADEKVKEEKKVKTTKRPEIDPVQIATDAATSAARAVADSFKPKEAKKEEVADFLTDEEKDELLVFQEMGRLNPAYKGLATQYRDSVKRIENYRQAWAKENPEKEFDPEDEAHDDFYKRVAPQFNERDYRKAEARLAGMDMVKDIETKTQSETASLKAELAEKELTPIIHSTKIHAAVEILKGIDPAHLKAVEKDGFDKFREQEPTIADALSISASRLSGFIEAARQIDEPKARIPIDLKNPAHNEYINYLIAKEDEMKSRPMKDQLDEQGRMFSTRTDMLSMQPSMRKRYWFYNDDLLISERISEETEMAKKFVENENQRMEKFAKLRGWKMGDASKPSQQAEKNGSSHKEEKRSDVEKIIESPEASGGGKVDSSAPGDKKTDADFFERSASILFRR